jgi:hypothetical protein
MPACLPACLPFSKGDELTYALNAQIYSGRKVLAAKRRHHHHHHHHLFFGRRTRLVEHVRFLDE